MKTFSVEVEELTYDTFEIQAESAREAQDIVLRKITEIGDLVIGMSYGVDIKSVEEVT